MDQELIAYLDQRFRESSQQIAGLREEMTSFREETSARFERVEEAIRHTRVEVEGLRDQIRLLAEGIINFDERLERFRGEVQRELDSIRGLFMPLLQTVQDRVRSLESWRETRERDPIDIIKERYGPQSRRGPQAQAG
jgi:predicted nuclease with TOPRIM domain